MKSPNGNNSRAPAKFSTLVPLVLHSASYFTMSMSHYVFYVFIFFLS